MFDNASDEVASPCCGLCSLDAADVCRGCHRTRSEIACWLAANQAQRQAIVEQAEKRRRRLEHSSLNPLS